MPSTGDLELDVVVHHHFRNGAKNLWCYRLIRSGE